MPEIPELERRMRQDGYWFLYNGRALGRYPVTVAKRSLTYVMGTKSSARLWHKVRVVILVWHPSRRWARVLVRTKCGASFVEPHFTGNPTKETMVCRRCDLFAG